MKIERPVIIQRPVIILGMARSGTSLVSSIFYAHGFWSGYTPKVHPGNYPTGQHENQAIKRLLIKRYGRADKIMTSVDYDQSWENVAKGVLEKEGYKGGRWFMKHSALYAKIWVDFNPFWICIRRDKDAILDSIRRKSRIYDNKDDSFLFELIDNHNNIMNEILETYGGFDINSEKIINGDHFELLLAFQGVGCILDYEIVKKIVKPEIWGVTV